MYGADKTLKKRKKLLFKSSTHKQGADLAGGLLRDLLADAMLQREETAGEVFDDVLEPTADEELASGEEVGPLVHEEDTGLESEEVQDSLQVLRRSSERATQGTLPARFRS